YAPRHKLTFTARFHANLPGDTGELAFLPSVNYQSLQYNVPFAVRIPNAGAGAVPASYNQAAHLGGIIPGYTTIDMRLEWNRILGSRFDVAVAVTNLTNKIYLLGNGTTLAAAGVQGNAYAPPRMVTVDL